MHRFATKYTYIEYHSVCPLVGIGTLPPPLSPATVPLPRTKGGGGAHSPANEGVGESQFRRLEKKLSTLPTLCLQAFVLDVKLTYLKTKLVESFLMF